MLLLVSVFIISCGGRSGVKPKDNATKGRRILKSERVFVKEPLSRKYSTIVIPDFSFENAEIQKVDEIKDPDFKVAVKKLGSYVPDKVAAYLKSWKVFKKVIRVKKAKKTYRHAVVLKGRFTKITSGSRALRWFVGFGAGSSTLSVDGELIDAAHKTRLARFIQSRHSPFSGAGYHTIFKADGVNMAKDIARFIKKLY